MVAENIHIIINFQKLGKARYGLGVKIDIILTVQYWQFITKMHNKCTVSQESVFFRTFHHILAKHCDRTKGESS